MQDWTVKKEDQLKILKVLDHQVTFLITHEYLSQKLEDDWSEIITDVESDKF